MITEDRRAFRRVPTNITVKYAEWGSSKSLWGIAITKNISLGGVYFQSMTVIPIGHILDIRIQVPGEKREGRWKARVVRCDKVEEKMISVFGIAVEFMRDFDHSELILREFFAKIA